MVNFDSITLLKALDYFVLSIFAICIISGFVKGMFRTTYNLVVFVGSILLGWFLMPAIIEFILDYDFSFLNLTINGSTLTTFRETIPAIVGSLDPTIGSLMVEGTETYTLIFALVFSAARLILMLVWLLLTLTVFKFVFWIIYLIIRPRRKDAQGNLRRKVRISFWWSYYGEHRFCNHCLVAIPLLD